MAFSFSQASSVLNVAELQYAVGPKVRFTTFTSCLGVLAKHARNRAMLVGVHVPLYQGSVSFTANDADTVRYIISKCGGNVNSAVIIGCADVWKKSNPAGWRALLARLGNPQVYALAEGRYGGEAKANGEIEFTY